MLGQKKKENEMKSDNLLQGMSTKDFVAGIVIGAVGASGLYLLGSMSFLVVVSYILLGCALLGIKLYLEQRGWTSQFEFKSEDKWLGIYHDQKDRMHVWICLVPCVPLHLTGPALTGLNK